MTQPVVFVWTELHVCVEGGVVERVRVMVPHPRYARVAAKQFTEGGEYPLEIVQYRSMASHNQYFAAIADAFSNLPEKIAASFPTDTHLRKWALIRCKHFEQKQTTWDTRTDAIKHATYIRTDDVYAETDVEEVDGRWTVIVRVAKSQDLRSMSRDEFERSKKDVLELLESMISIPRGSLMKQAESHA